MADVIKGYMMKSIWSMVKALTLSSLFLSQVLAAPVFNKELSFVQPDSSFVPVIVNGDEFHQRVEDLHGRTLVRDDEGWICYASLNSDSTELIPGERYTGTNRISRSGEELHIDLKSDAIQAKTQKQRQQLFRQSAGRSSRNDRLTPGIVTGNKVGLTILIDFEDQPAAVTRDAVDQVLNGDNGVTVKNYFSAVSGGRLNYTNHVVGYYRASNNKSHYDNNTQPYGISAMELVEEALNWLDSTDFDFSVLTTQNREVLALNVLYAGRPSGGWSSGLWPHMGAFYWRGSRSGYSTYSYQISDFNSSDESIGTLCHETGHMLLNYPDLYPYSGSTNWVGRYCLMSYGGMGDVPVPPNPYFRSESGWLDFEDITDVENGTIQMTSNDASRAISYRNSADQNQLLVMESVDRSGTFAQDMPANGMVIWKVNKRGDNTNANMNNPFIAVAGGTSANSTISNRPALAFSSTTTPAATWLSGGNAEIELFNLSASGSTMTFDLGVGGDTVGVDTAGVDTTGVEEGTFTLTTLAENGVVRLSETGPDFAEGSVITITAVPNSGYVFDYWSGDLAGSTNPATITMTANKSITAHFKFEQNNYITMPSGDMNVIRIMQDTIFYDDGGPNGDYANSVNGTVAIRPGIFGKAVQIEFEEFAVEEKGNGSTEYDSLEIFNGNTLTTGTEGLSMGSWYGTNSPGVVTSTAENGALTLSWSANSTNSAPGWKARITLVDKVDDIVNLVTSEQMKYEAGLRVVQNQIALSLPSAGNYTVDLFTSNGRLIETVSGTVHSAGVQKLRLNRPAAGVFIARLRAGNIVVTQRFVLK